MTDYSAVAFDHLFEDLGLHMGATSFNAFECYVESLDHAAEAFDTVEMLEAALVRAGVRRHVASDFCESIDWVLKTFQAPQKTISHMTLYAWISQLFHNYIQQLGDDDDGARTIASGPHVKQNYKRTDRADGDNRADGSGGDTSDGPKDGNASSKDGDRSATSSGGDGGDGGEIPETHKDQDETTSYEQGARKRAGLDKRPSRFSRGLKPITIPKPLPQDPAEAKEVVKALFAAQVPETIPQNFTKEKEVVKSLFAATTSIPSRTFTPSKLLKAIEIRLRPFPTFAFFTPMPVTLYHGVTLRRYKRMLHCCRWSRSLSSAPGDFSIDPALYFSNDWLYAFMWSNLKACSFRSMRLIRGVVISVSMDLCERPLSIIPDGRVDEVISTHRKGVPIEDLATTIVGRFSTGHLNELKGGGGHGSGSGGRGHLVDGEGSAIEIEGLLQVAFTDEEGERFLDNQKLEVAIVGY
ncbi:hypothetical protein FN846DRAFT_919833 [Sphaerosporella brunnea]|uniref:Uncharacterized protein n=1 Tax=Sphaerosporella brunnea TaxID=1250544 RepID=A0A5J5EUM1_9PEZI|nr:hypothetical protein FN846DRAFT_919833 [Sphaerosporella brunnea]